jgi:putative oxidoreductase
MTSTRVDFAALILRLSIGGMLLLHGIAKVTGGVDGIETMLTNHGLPAQLAYGVYVGEVVAPVLLIVGLLVEFAAFAIVVNMGVAIYMAHAAEVLTRNEHGGWAIELPALYLFGALACGILGSGSIALRRRTY